MNNNQIPNNGNAFPPVGDNGNQFPQKPNYGTANPQGFPNSTPQPKPKKKGGCLKWGAISVGVLIVLGMIFGDSETENSTPSSKPTQEAASQPEASIPAAADAASPDKPAAEKPKEKTAAKDATVSMGQEVELRRAKVTASNFHFSGPDVFGNMNACGTATVTNTSEKTLSLNPFTNWKLQDPSGVGRDYNFTTESNWESVELAPQGNYSGTICFKTDAQPGTYTLTFQEGFAGGSAKWTADM